VCIHIYIYIYIYIYIGMCNTPETPVAGPGLERERKRGREGGRQTDRQGETGGWVEGYSAPATIAPHGLDL
jgi:hypothetical protein